jgi:hypothetical protein
VFLKVQVAAELLQCRLAGLASQAGAAVDRNEKKKASSRMTPTANKERSSSDASKARLGKEPADGMSPVLQAHIGRQVRAMFDEVAEEPIPDHLLRLLNDLDQSGKK